MGGGIVRNKRNIFTDKQDFRFPVKICGVYNGYVKNYNAAGALSPKLSLAIVDTTSGAFTVTLALGNPGQRMVVYNSGATNDLTIDVAGSGANVTVAAGVAKELICIGTTWVAIS